MPTSKRPQQPLVREPDLSPKRFKPDNFEILHIPLIPAAFKKNLHFFFSGGLNELQVEYLKVWNSNNPGYSLTVWIDEYGMLPGLKNRVILDKAYGIYINSVPYENKLEKFRERVQAVRISAESIVNDEVKKMV